MGQVQLLGVKTEPFPLRGVAQEWGPESVAERKAEGTWEHPHIPGVFHSLLGPWKVEGAPNTLLLGHKLHSALRAHVCFAILQTGSEL